MLIRSCLSPLVLLGLGLSAVSAGPNVLWINAEDIGPAFGCYGHPDAVTPNVDRLAQRGVLYRNAFATAPICAPARSCLITGIHATSLGTQHLRAVVRRPEFVRTLPEHLRERGYYCAASWKTDYNFDAKGVWDHQSNDLALWRKRPVGKPFFTMITLGVTHEGRVNLPDRFREATADLPATLRHEPSAVTLPPYWPDSPLCREIWARQHDLITTMDRQVGETLRLLEEDGLVDETIVVFFADHGYGLPRAKRWLNDSGLRVPLIVVVPPGLREKDDPKPGTETERLVSFVDFAPTTLSLLGVDPPEPMQGRAFLGEFATKPREYVFAARSRADDMFECSRGVHDGRYLYVRHYMPHLPYIQGGEITGDRKDSYRELRRLHRAGKLPPAAEAMWAKRKPLEELYDLRSDPHEIRNLATSAEHREVLARMRPVLREWILRSRDTGFANEAEYQIRAAAASATPYEVVRDERAYPLERILATAELVGSPDVSSTRILKRLGDEDSVVRYQAALALLAREKNTDTELDALRARLDDSSPSVRIVAAETVIRRTSLPEEAAYSAFDATLRDERPWVALQAARSAYFLGERAAPLKQAMKDVVDANRSDPGSSRPWKDFNYAAFTTWALEAALANVE